MNSKQICEIVTWIRSHPEHVDESFEDDTPAEAWFRFCRDSTLIKEYDHSEYTRMTEKEVSVGCNYIFSGGSFEGDMCHLETLPGKKCCAFHDHLIFSKEVRDYLRDLHADINESFDVPRPTVSPSPNQIIVKLAYNGLFEEVSHKLALRLEGNVPKCVGYFSSDHLISPLTPELKAFCEQAGITYS